MLKDIRIKKKYILFVFLSLFVIPFLINLVYKKNLPWRLFTSEWDAGDALSFYGVLLGSGSTILGVYLSIKSAQENYRNDEKNRVKPYFALTHYQQYMKFNLLTFGKKDAEQKVEDEERRNVNSDNYREYKLEKIYITIAKNGIIFTDNLADEQKKILYSGGFGWENKGNGHYVIESTSIISIPIEAENVGNGAAINTKIAFYKKDETRRAATVYTIKQNCSFYFHLFCEDSNILIGSDYVIELMYGDIIGNYYSQNYPISFKRDHSNKKIYSSIDFTGNQIIEKS